jgi:hypothetical protein
MSRHKTKGAGCQFDGDVAIGVFVVEHCAVERDRGVRTEREIGVVGHDELCRALLAGAHRLVAHQAVADVDGHAQRTGDTSNLVLHENRFADAGLRMGRIECCSRKGQQDRDEENMPTPIH